MKDYTQPHIRSVINSQLETKILVILSLIRYQRPKKPGNKRAANGQKTVK